VKNVIIYSLVVIVLFPGFVRSEDDLPVTLFTPSVNGFNVSINGVGHGLTGPMLWNWGDGNEIVSWFPARYTYKKAGSYQVKVTGKLRKDGRVHSFVRKTNVVIGSRKKGSRPGLDSPQARHQSKSDEGSSARDHVVDRKIFGNRSVMGLCTAPDGKVYYVDYFQNRLGIVHVEEEALEVLISGLNRPRDLKWHSNKIYFIENGNYPKKVNGTLSVFDPSKKTRKVIRGDLPSPQRLFVDKSGAIFVCLYPYKSDQKNRVIKFSPGSSDYVEIVEVPEPPTAVAVDQNGSIYIGTISNPSPGDKAKLYKLAPGNSSLIRVLSGLPSVQDICIDSYNNIFIAGFGSDYGNKRAILLLLEGSSDVITLMDGYQATCLTLKGSDSIIYSTGRSSKSIRSLKY
jgi:hypothetical protein